MSTVTIKPNVREELEAVLPHDRVVEIDDRGYVSLSDKEFYITSEEILDGVFEPKRSVPTSVTPRQFKLALLELGILDNASAYADASSEFKIYFEDSLGFDRSHPMLIEAAHLLGMTDEQLDQLFILAGSK